MNFQLQCRTPFPRLALATMITLVAILLSEVSLIAQFSTTSKPEGYPLGVQLGKASCYSVSRIDRITASGEHYHSGDYTAAHKTLPFNTMVRVTNLKNGQSVIVRINDRGPYRKGRILDLSMAAAGKIHMISTGIVPVKIEVLTPAHNIGST